MIRNIKSLFTILACFFTLYGHSQIRFLPAFFRPSLEMEVDYLSNPFKKDAALMETLSANIGAVIPVKTKLGVKMDWSELKQLLKVRKLKDLKYLTRIVQPKAKQIFWNFNVNGRQLEYTGKFISPIQDFANEKNYIFGLSTGITGLNYLKRRFFMIYAFNAGFSEDANSIEKIHPNATVVLGAGKLHSLKLYSYWGMMVFYTNYRILPIPFIGLEAKLSKKWHFSATLPAEMSLIHRINKKIKISARVAYDGFTTGLNNQIFPETEATRYGLRFGHLRVGPVFEAKIKKKTRISASLGWTGFQQLQLSNKREVRFNDQPNASFYAQIHCSHQFGKSLFDSSIGAMIQ